MTMIKTKVFAQIDKETLHKKGDSLGLSGEALEMFKCFTEVPLVIEVNEKGQVWDVRALWMVDDTEEGGDQGSN